MSGQTEAAKLEKHLALLREEYVKLQNRLVDAERKYETLAVSVGDPNLSEKSFVNRLLRKVTELFEKDLYSDITIHLEGHQLRAHRFVLAARSDAWGDLTTAEHVELQGISYSIGYTLLKWVYTDQLDSKLGDGFVVDLMKAAKQYSLDALLDRCEQLLMSRLDVGNSVKLYQSADALSAEKLKSKCLQLIMARWDDFTAADFQSMSAPLLYKILCTKSEFPLHSAIRLRREDVVFLYLIEFDAQLKTKINERDNDGFTPLGIALSLKEASIAKTLLSHHADVNGKDAKGNTLLVSAIQQVNSFACKFLLDAGADVRICEPAMNRSPLHLLSAISPSSCSNSVNLDGLLDCADVMIQRAMEINGRDIHGETPLQLSIRSNNEPMFHLLLSHGVDVDVRNVADESPLWLALQSSASAQDLSLAQKLVNKGADVNAVFSETGSSLLHRCIEESVENGAVFLLRNHASTSLLNRKGESALHLACAGRMQDLVRKLLAEGAECNVQTKTGCVPDHQTALHIAVVNDDVDLVRIFVEHNDYCERHGSGEAKSVDFSLLDSLDDTAFSSALWRKDFEMAKLLAKCSDLNSKGSSGIPLLCRAIAQQREEAALFLIANGADVNARSDASKSDYPLLAAVKSGMTEVVRELCKHGADLSVRDADGNCALWLALEKKNEDAASILVEHGCDRDSWSLGPTGCMETLLHRAIDTNNEAAACFLVRSVCDVNAMKRPGPNGTGEEEAREKLTPLHMAASWGLESVASILLEMGGNVNAQDIEGKTPIHVAVINQNTPILSILLKPKAANLGVKDRKGLTPFATALTMKSGNKAAKMILDREPRAASQVDGKGYNFLHQAVKNADLESVLFLLSIHIDVNTPTNDADRFTPLHLAASAGDEMIMRNLLLAGASINDRTSIKQTALHIAAANDQPKMCSILLENNIDYDAVDNGANNALHIGIQAGSLSCVRVLLTESRINAEVPNVKGQMPLHILGIYGKENAASMFDVFVDTMPNYNVDAPDAEGNTMMLLAYINGNAQLCKAATRVGACLGAINSHGISIFNYKTPTKQLLFRLLDQLTREPKWADGEICSECGTKFTITLRKHHCRHCGRLLCAKCSDQQMPIIKYDLQKPVRVCDICFDVLTLGTHNE